MEFIAKLTPEEEKALEVLANVDCDSMHNCDNCPLHFEGMKECISNTAISILSGLKKPKE